MNRKGFVFVSESHGEDRDQQNEKDQAITIQVYQELYELDSDKLVMHPKYKEFWVKDKNTTIMSGSYNLVGTIIGGGVLSLPYGLQKSGILVFSILLFIFTILTSWSLSLLPVCAMKTGAKSFTELGNLVFGPFIGGMISFSLAFITYLLSIGYSILLRDIVPPVLSVFHILEDPDRQTKNIVMVCTVLLVFPLCAQKHLHRLWFSSALSILSASILLICLVYHSIKANMNEPHFNQIQILPTNLGDCIYIYSIMCVAFLCQFNLLPLYWSFREPTKERVNKLINLSSVFCSIIYFLCSFFGYTIAYDNTQGNIFNNFPIDDRVMTFGRIGMGFTIFFSIPLMLLPCRENLFELFFSLFQRKNSSVQSKFFTFSFFSDDTEEVIARYVCTIILFSSLLSISWYVDSVVVVWNIIGSTVGILVGFILPPLFYLKICNTDYRNESLVKVYSLLIFGSLSLILCSYETIVSL